jgi:hypothetical protein
MIGVKDNEAPDIQKKPSKRAIEGRTEAADTKKVNRYREGIPGLVFDTCQKIAVTLAENICLMGYGEVSVSCKIHGGRIVSICHSITDNRIEKAAQ